MSLSQAAAQSLSQYSIDGQELDSDSNDHVYNGKCNIHTHIDILVQYSIFSSFIEINIS